MNARRVQTLSVMEGGKTRYETRERFGRVGAWFVRLVLRRDLQFSFEAMAGALKERAEAMVEES